MEHCWKYHARYRLLTVQNHALYLANNCRYLILTEHPIGLLAACAMYVL